MDAFTDFLGPLGQPLGLLSWAVGPVATVLILLLLLRWGVRWLRRMVLLALVLIIAAVLALNGPLFETALGLLLDRVGAEADVEIAFRSAEGNLLTGRAELRGVRVRRVDHPESVYDLTAATVDLDVAVASLVSGRPRFQHVAIDGLEGVYRRRAGPWVEGDGEEGTSADETGDEDEFTIDHLRVHDARVELVDASQGAESALALVVDELVAENVRGETALFDVLFRSHATGTVEGQRYRLSVREEGGVYTSTWQFEALPTDFLSHRLSPSLDRLSEGLVGLEVESAWTDEGDDALDMRWRLGLWTPEVDLSWARLSEAERVDAIFASPLEARLAVGAAIGLERFRHAPVLSATGLWDEVSRELAPSLSDGLPSGWHDAREGIGDVLENWINGVRLR